MGDDGEEFPEAEKIVQEFWDYDGDDRAAAVEISGEFLERRKKELAERGERGERGAR